MLKTNLYNWIINQHFYYKKQNVRPWGTYDLLVSTDNSKWAKLPLSFGYGFTEPQALEMTLISMIQDENFINFIIQWLGDEKLKMIRTCIAQDADAQIGISMATLPPTPISETPNVSEHIHNAENV